MSGLQLFNTLTRKVETFHPLIPGRVKMFVCGPTVQGLPHVGHAKTYALYDVLARYLVYKGFRLSYVMNITDVDDKIVSAARLAGESSEEYASRYSLEFIKDMKDFGLLKAVRFEPASKYIPEIIQQVERLVEKGCAYSVNGEVYFDSSSYSDFGALSHQTRNQMLLRPTDLSANKRNPLDFALWRRASEEEPSWDSPWGRGKPGWHIEDTAISISNFGPQYDIHGGADELIYPHHEAEIAQAECFTGVAPFVRYWVHSGLLLVQGRKMSKSEGNALYLRDVLKKYGAGPLRLYVLSVYYRNTIEFDEARLEHWVETYSQMVDQASVLKDKTPAGWRKSAPTRELGLFLSSLERDLDTREAETILIKALKTVKERNSPNELKRLAQTVHTMSRILGLDASKFSGIRTE
ncbi:MAG: cysteine--tRNA ligase [Thermoprotei archaeon]